MKISPSFCVVVLLALCAGPAALPTPSFALDEGGCLTCHQYPGLVRLEKAGDPKPLHIDEKKYFSSAHGKLRCVKCHTTVAKVPHTGETQVDCTTECHQGDKEKKLPENYSLKGFHKDEQAFLVSLQEESSCRVCHPLYPHSSNNLVRGFLNLHAGFMYCEVCHIDRSKFKSLTYDWQNAENAEFSGKPYGTYYNPQTGKAAKDEHFISRIAAFEVVKGEKRQLLNTRDVAGAKAFLTQAQSRTPAQQEKALKYFHGDIQRKEISVACNECHAVNGVLDFEKLGFEPKKAQDLIYLNIKGLVTKYKIFYFPKLF